MTDKEIAGRSPSDICEAEAGGLIHRAILLQDLGGDLEAVVEEWAYDPDPLAVEFVALCREFAACLQGLHLADDGSLVDAGEQRCVPCEGSGRQPGGLRRDCAACGGSGVAKTDDQQPGKKEGEDVR